MRSIRLTLCVISLLFPVLVQAHSYTLDNLSIDHPWARATAPGAPVGGGYLSIHNSGDEPDRLIGGSVDFAGEVQVHESSMNDGMMRMQHLEAGLLLPANETVVLRPGSYHLMFMGLERRLVEGERERITLEFERAGSIDVELSIEGPGEKGPHQEGGEMSHGEMDHDDMMHH